MTHHYRPRATEAALTRVLCSMTAEETQALYRRAQATGTSIREVVGRVADRADMWQFVELVVYVSTAPDGGYDDEDM